MSNKPIKMNKLRTIIRLYEEQTGLKTIAVMARTSRNTVKSISKSGTVWVCPMKRSNKKAKLSSMIYSVFVKAAIPAIRGWKNWTG